MILCVMVDWPKSDDPAETGMLGGLARLSLENNSKAWGSPYSLGKTQTHPLKLARVLFEIGLI